MGSGPTITDLHCLAIGRGFPRDQVHEILHNLAEFQFDAASLTELRDNQRAALADIVRAHYKAPPRSPRRRSSRPAGKKRPAGVIAMITPRQRDFIVKLTGEMNWSKSLLSGFLRTHFDAGSIEQLATSKRAAKAIGLLLAYKRKKDFVNRYQCERERRSVRRSDIERQPLR